MANHTTGAQRRNDRMEKIFARAKSEGRGLVGDSHTKGAGVHSPAMEKAHKMAEKMGGFPKKFHRNTAQQRMDKLVKKIKEYGHE